ncbi:hypothetical protein Vadar_024190 [Vaccinium darrowii]|uniref:Uncharacterized protein n=1 Tax=Vaccinium darrowii TaxID=229202 RepID=A0ACB7YPF8_9ERIC|nr:hypothetical protein Vadar_024190 [Vaccinium darrowii]
MVGVGPQEVVVCPGLALYQAIAGYMSPALMRTEIEMRAAGLGVVPQFQLPVPVDDFMQRSHPTDQLFNRNNFPSFNFPAAQEGRSYRIHDPCSVLISSYDDGKSVWENPGQQRAEALESLIELCARLLNAFANGDVEVELFEYATQPMTSVNNQLISVGDYAWLKASGFNDVTDTFLRPPLLNILLQSFYYAQRMQLF